MKIDLFTIAEGGLPDSRGAITLLAVNQRVVTSEKFPFTHKATVFVTLSSEGEEENLAEPSLLAIRLRDTKSEIQFTFSQPIAVPPNTWEDLPQLVNLVIDVPVTATSPGVFTIEVEHSPTGERFERKLYIVDAEVVRRQADPDSPRKAFD